MPVNPVVVYSGEPEPEHPERLKAERRRLEQNIKAIYGDLTGMADHLASFAKGLKSDPDRIRIDGMSGSVMEISGREAYRFRDIDTKRVADLLQEIRDNRKKIEAIDRALSGR